jgi:hypothetical protein
MQSMPFVFRPHYSMAAALAAGLAGLLLCGSLAGCLLKDKPDKALSSGGLTPPWDPAKFMPKTLEGFAYAGPESLFTVFGEIARLDSLVGDPKSWKADPDAVDTLRVSQVLDTAFIFPQNPEASMPYGYDDAFRDDTLYRNAFGNGLYMQDHPCAATFVLSGQFLHPAKWVRKGMKAEDITAALGTPLYRQQGVLRYLSHRPSPPPEKREGDSLSTASDYSAYEIFEGINFYFRNDSLFAAVLQKSQPCH